MLVCPGFGKSADCQLLSFTLRHVIGLSSKAIFQILPLPFAESQIWLCQAWKDVPQTPGVRGAISDNGDVPGTDVSSREMFDKELPLKDQNYPKLLGLLRQSIVVDVCRPMNAIQ